MNDKLSQSPWPTGTREKGISRGRTTPHWRPAVGVAVGRQPGWVKKRSMARTRNPSKKARRIIMTACSGEERQVLCRRWRWDANNMKEPEKRPVSQGERAGVANFSKAVGSERGVWVWVWFGVAAQRCTSTTGQDNRTRAFTKGKMMLRKDTRPGKARMEQLLAAAKSQKRVRPGSSRAHD